MIARLIVGGLLTVAGAATLVGGLSSGNTTLMVCGAVAVLLGAIVVVFGGES